MSIEVQLENFHKDSGQSRLRGLSKSLFQSTFNLRRIALYLPSTMSDDGGYGGGGDDFDYESGGAGYGTSIYLSLSI